MSSRYIPADIRRELRQEVNFGCAYCGVPIIQHHHIIPYAEIEEHRPEEMIALCPNCHSEADAGSISRGRLYQLKENPHNSDVVDYMFYFEPNPPLIQMGSATIEFGEQGKVSLLRINGEDVIVARYERDRIHFDIHFFSKDGDLIASITDTDWWAKTAEVWDLKYKKTWFKLWNKDEEVGLKIEFDEETGIIFFKGIFHYKDESVKVTPSKFRYDEQDIEIHGVGYIMGGEEKDQDFRLSNPVNRAIIHRTGVTKASDGSMRAGVFAVGPDSDPDDSFVWVMGRDGN